MVVTGARGTLVCIVYEVLPFARLTARKIFIFKSFTNVGTFIFIDIALRVAFMNAHICTYIYTRRKLDIVRFIYIILSAVLHGPRYSTTEQ